MKKDWISGAVSVVIIAASSALGIMALGRTEENPERYIENDYKDYLDGIGENGQVSVEGDFVNVSVVTNDPGLVLQKSLKIGQLTNVSIVNLKLKDIKNNGPEIYIMHTSGISLNFSPVYS